MKVDTHIHTQKFSADAKMSYNEILNYLDSNNDVILCTCEHYDYPGDKTNLMFDSDDYYKTYKTRKANFKKEYNRPYPVLFGAELGYVKGLDSYYNSFSSLYPFDMLIGSVHYIYGVDPFYDRSIFTNKKQKTYADYLQVLIQMLENCDAFDIMGHFDYLCRYTPYDNPKILYKDFPDYFDQIFKLLIEKEKVLELNTATSVYMQSQGFTDYMPDKDIFKRYFELGGKLVSYASDAHKISNLFNLYSESVDFLKSIGFKHLYYFDQRKIQEIKI